MVPSTTICPVSVTSRAVAGRDRVDGEAGGPHGDVGRDGRAVGGRHARRLRRRATAACSWTVMPSRSKTFAQVARPLRREPVAEAAAGGEGDVEVRAGLGDLGGGLEAGQAAADDDHASARRRGAARRSRSRRAPGRLAISWACSAAPGTPWSFQPLPRA